MPGLKALTVALLLALAGDAAADACSRRIQVAASAVGRGMIIGANGQVSGAVRDLLDDVARRSGCVFDYVEVPRARAWAMLETGGVDLVPAATQSPERDRYGRFVHTHSARTMIAGVDKRLAGIGRLDDILRLRLQIGVVRGYQFGAAYAAFIRQLEQAGLVHKVADPDTLLRLLAAGRIDASILPLSAISDAVEKAGAGGTLVASELVELPKMDIGIYISTGRVPAGDVSRLEAAIKGAVDRGDYERYMRRHYPAWSLRGISKN
jgi:polar amino acid transport system substrate-binding protein